MTAAAPIETAEDISNPAWLAKRLRINIKKVYEELEAGNIPGVKRFGRNYRVHKPTVEQWIACDMRRT